MSNNYSFLIHKDSKSKYKGGFKSQNGRMNNTSAYNHDYYINNKDKWQDDDFEDITTENDSLSKMFGHDRKSYSVDDNIINGGTAAANKNSFQYKNKSTGDYIRTDKNGGFYAYNPEKDSIKLDTKCQKKGKPGYSGSFEKAKKEAIDKGYMNKNDALLYNKTKDTWQVQKYYENIDAYKKDIKHSHIDLEDNIMSNNYSFLIHGEDELYHYGVPGMRWGFRKNPERALQKTVRQLEKYGQRAEKGAKKASDRNRYKQAKLQRKATKYQLKSQKVRAANNRKFFRMSDAKAGKKMLKYDKKAAKYADKSAKMAKAIAKGKAKSERNIKKGQKMYAELQKQLKNTPMNKVNQADINRGREIARKYGFGG